MTYKFHFKPFSLRQRKVMNWWADTSPVKDADGIICDGAIRSGKTVCMSLSFALWAMHRFNGKNFALCGKTVNSLRRNLLQGLMLMLRSQGYTVTDRVTDNIMIVRRGNVENRFYIFGGKDESSAGLVQGVTLAGVLFDEVALMPESFVNQATARCSEEGSTFWFNCNPEGPNHWFYEKWIKKSQKRNLLYLHFTMDDNYSLSPRIKERYRRMYTGVFYDRFILGKWVVATGLIYPAQAAGEGIVPVDATRRYTRYFVSVDYGTVNPFSAGLWGLSAGVWYRIRELYWNSKKEGRQRTDHEHYNALDDFIGDLPVEAIIVDPSAASFMECVRREGKYRARAAKNDVMNGIRATASAFSTERIKVCDCCTDAIAEFSAYRWDEKSPQDKPIKESDHAMDDIRYFVSTVVQKEGANIYSNARV